MKKLLLFDVDGTICDSGKIISSQMASQLNSLANLDYVLGIVGGGAFNKILYQLDEKVIPEYIFSECGSVYHKFNFNSNNYELININNLRLEPEYPQINQLVKTCLKYISETDYLMYYEQKYSSDMMVQIIEESNILE